MHDEVKCSVGQCSALVPWVEGSALVPWVEGSAPGGRLLCNGILIRGEVAQPFSGHLAGNFFKGFKMGQSRNSRIIKIIKRAEPRHIGWHCQLLVASNLIL